jgi:hypothetical protein
MVPPQINLPEKNLSTISPSDKRLEQVIEGHNAPNVATLALGSQPRKGVARLRAKRKT